MKKHLFFLQLAFVLSVTAPAQNTFQQALTADNGFLYDAKIKTANDGGLILACNYVPRNGNNKVMLARFGANAKLLWAKAFGDSISSYYPASVIACADGGFVVAGESLDAVFMPFVVKYSAEGNMLWQRRFSFNASGYYSMYARAAIASKNHTVLVTGATNLSSLGDAFVLSINDSDGSVNWFRATGTVGLHETGFSLSNTADNGFVLGGFSGYPGSLSDKFFVIKYNSKGRPEWTKTFWNTNSFGNDDITGITATSDGGYAFTGFTYTTQYSYDRVLVKLSADGSLQWGRQLKKPTYDMSGDVFENNDGAYIIGGSGDQDAIFTRFSADGTAASSAHFNLPQSYGALTPGPHSSFLTASTALSAIVVSKFSGLAINCGATTLTDTAQDFSLNIFNPAYRQFDLTDSLLSPPIALHEIPVTLNVKSLCNAAETVAAVDISDAGTKENAAPFAVSVYPNPVAGSRLTIKLAGIKSPVVSLYIADAYGTIITKYNYSIATGTSFIKDINIAQLKAGIYMLTVVDGNKKSMVKFVKAE